MPNEEDEKRLAHCIKLLNDIAIIIQSESEDFDYDMFVDLGSGMSLLYRAIGLVAVSRALENQEQNVDMRNYLHDCNQRAKAQQWEVDSDRFLELLIKSIDGVSGSDAEE